MKVKMKSIKAGPSGNAMPGETIDISAEEAKALTDGGFADEVVETASIAPPEKAVLPKAKPKTVRSKK